MSAFASLSSHFTPKNCGSQAGAPASSAVHKSSAIKYNKNTVPEWPRTSTQFVRAFKLLLHFCHSTLHTPHPRTLCLNGPGPQRSSYTLSCCCFTFVTPHSTPKNTVPEWPRTSTQFVRAFMLLLHFCHSTLHTQEHCA